LAFHPIGNSEPERLFTKRDMILRYRARKYFIEHQNTFFHIRCDAEQNSARKTTELMQIGAYAAIKSVTVFSAQWFAICTSWKEALMKTLASILVLGAALMAMPAIADPLNTSDKPIVLAGGQFCVGPACVGRYRDRDWEYRHHRGYAWDRDSGCRDVTIRRDDGSVTHIRRCD
jgi:hypothetical protein